jgi:hypothetical protein
MLPIDDGAVRGQAAEGAAKAVNLMLVQLGGAWPLELLRRLHYPAWGII